MLAKIKRYFNYFNLFLMHKNKKTFLNIFLSELKGINTSEAHIEKNNINSQFYFNKLVILTTKHCYFVAHSIKNTLADEFDSIEILQEKPMQGYEDCLHFVICPNFFQELPKRYIAYQMEQSISNRWFDKKYFNILNNALSVCDYSNYNIQFLRNNGIPFSSLNYLPIGYFRNYKQYLGVENVIEDYDVVFYGDINCQRRRAFLEQISKRFKTLIIYNLFGIDLVKQLLRAKIVINIHYYDYALLETPRIFESLSLDKIVISEESSDMREHENLKDIVDFVKEMDISGMIEKISYWLNNATEMNKKISRNRFMLNGDKFSNKFYLHRFLLSLDLIKYHTFYQKNNSYINIKKINGNGAMVCLSTKESIERRKSFTNDTKEKNIAIFDGLRHKKAWVGCGLSYKAIINKAKDLKLDYVIILEDDVDFTSDFWFRLDVILSYLKINTDWDIFCGLLTDTHDDLKISNIASYKNELFLHVNKFCGMVCNIYSKRSFDKILEWDNLNTNLENNAIDRFLEHANLKIITTLPFLAGHKEELNSTLWNGSNINYRQLIASSINKLNNKQLDWTFCKAIETNQESVLKSLEYN